MTTNKEQSSVTASFPLTGKIGILTFFFISGITSLIYEVIWVRIFSHSFGNTIYSVSTILAAFMAGLGLGSYLFGKYSARIKNCLRTYALLEFLIGISALLIQPAVKSLLPINRYLFQLQTGESQFLYFAFVFISSFLLLLVPTTFMGGTLPLLSQAFIREKQFVGRGIGFLYFFNTIGASLGCLLAGFSFIPSFGVTNAIFLAATGNIIIAIGAFFVSKAEIFQKNQEISHSTNGNKTLPSRLFLSAVLVFLFTGFISLGFEVVWTRLLILIFGSTTYSFTIMLSIYLLGIAIGGILFGILVDKTHNSVRLLWFMLLAVGIIILASISIVNKMPEVFLSFIGSIGFQWKTYIFIKFLFSSIVLLPIAVLFGGIFPVAARVIISDTGQVGNKVGMLYLANTIGAIGGSLFTGFILLPDFGTQETIRIFSFLCFITLLTFLFFTFPAQKGINGKRFSPFYYISLLLLPLPFLYPSWNDDVLTAGVHFEPYKFLDKDFKIHLDEKLKKEKLALFLEGTTETATVRESINNLFYYIDGKVEASTLIKDMRLQRMMGYLPLLFHSKTTSALNIGLGAGISLGSLGNYPLKRLECVELEPEIVKVAQMFAAYNGNIIDNPILKIIFTDGRLYLGLTREKFDIITSDPFEPLVGGAANLYTLEHFQAAAKRLEPKGCMCQYLPMYQIFPRDFQMVIKTFHHVFPHILVFYSGVDTLLLGFQEKPELDINKMNEMLSIPKIKKDLMEIGFDKLEKVMGTFVLYLKPDSSVFSPSIPLNKDNHPFLEFNAPKAHPVNTTKLNIEFLKKYFVKFPVELFAAQNDSQKIGNIISKSHTLGKFISHGEYEIQNKNYSSAEKDFGKLVDLYPDDVYFIHEFSFALHEIAVAEIKKGKFKDAFEKLRKIVNLDSNNAFALADLAFIYQVKGDYKQALLLISNAMKIIPNNDIFIFRRAQIYFDLRRYNDALKDITIVKNNGRNDYPLWYYFTFSNYSMKKYQAAENGFIKLLSIKKEPEILYRYAEFKIINGNIEAALHLLLQAEKLDPNNVNVKIYLARVYAMLNKNMLAVNKADEAKKLNPELFNKILEHDQILQNIIKP